METKDTIEGITSQFHQNEDGIYLDYNATTPVLPAVWQKAAPYLTEYFGNPSSSHWAGHTPKEAIHRARTQVAMLIGACPEQIIFTSGGTEANYLALWGVLRDSDGGLILSSTIEHPAVSDPIQQLRKRNWHHQTLAVDTSGVIPHREIHRYLTTKVDAVSVMLANNETGMIQPVAQLREVLGDSVYIHTDAAQAVGKIPVNVRTLDVDALTIAGHKLYAPKGIGALYMKNPEQLRPIMQGGGQESGRRAGTENTPYIVALGAAAQLAYETLDAETVRLIRLRDQLLRQLKTEYPAVLQNGTTTGCLPNTLSVRFPGCNGQTLLAICPQIAASTGSACHDGNNTASPVLLSMGIPNDEALGTLRLSIGRNTTEEQIHIAAKTLGAAARATTEYKE